MKILFSSCLLAGLAVISIAQPVQRVIEPQPADGVYRVSERGPHHRTWQKLSQVQLPDGRSEIRTNSYVELTTGMHRWSQSDEKWIEADDEIEVLQDGAVARKSAHQVIFSNIANDPQGTADLTTPDGKRLRSRVVGLAYTETDTGRSVFIAEVKNTQGFVVGRNQVIYIDAFDDVNADIRYTSTRASFEADVILRERLPSPVQYGLKPETTKLEVWTEFLNPPEPGKTVVNRPREGGPGDADVTLEFGAMRIGRGKAFSLPEQLQQDPRENDAIFVSKEWQVIGGKSFLIETVPYAEAKPQIDRLPQAQARVNLNPQQRERLLARRDGPTRGRPVSLSERTPPLSPTRQLAKATSLPHRPGYVLDWITLNSGETNFVFSGDNTYYVSGWVTLSGTTSIEGGTVVKFNSYPTVTARLMVNGNVSCETSAYQPAIFTAKDDDTVGQTLDVSTGTPSGYYAFPALSFTSAAANSTLENLLIRYAGFGLEWDGGASTFYVRNLQMVQCDTALNPYNCTLILRNALFHNCDEVIIGSSSTVRGEHLTVNTASWFNHSSHTVYLTNSLIVAATNTDSFSGSNNQTPASSSGVFQSVGAGAHYLADNTYRNVGTTSIDADLLADLRNKTTYPPILLTGDITAPTVLSPQAQRDTDVPDLGYHYAGLDYLLGNGRTLTSTTLLLTNGVAVGLYGNGTDDGTALILRNGAKLISEGTADQLNWIVPVMAVQEQPNATWRAAYYAIEEDTDTGALKEVGMRFTAFSALAPSLNSFVFYYGSYFSGLSFRDCQFFGGRFFHRDGSANAYTVGITNCLFNRTYLTLEPSSTNPVVHLRNCLFRAGIFELRAPAGNTWSLYDNFFYWQSLDQNTNNVSDSGYNAYLGTTRISPNANNDVVLSSFAFAGGSWNTFYYSSTNLNNSGSQTADLSGLFHHTTQSSQTKEGVSQVDIGFHYVALNASNQPVDTDGDGLADYLEDRNGDGLVSSGESSLTTPDTDGDGLVDGWDFYPLDASYWASPYADPSDETAPTITLIAPPNTWAQYPNTNPTIDPIDPDPLVTTVNQESEIATVTISDAESPASSLILTVANNSNPSLVRTIQFGGSGGTRLMIVIPNDNQTGNATITLRVIDIQGTTGERAFTFTVNP